MGHHKYSVLKNAFTLAEVLITLGIIGVVAAMTLPVVIANYKKNLVVSRLKSTYSLMNEAFRRSVADNGPAIYWDYNLKNPEFWNRYYAPYIESVKICNWGEQDSAWTESWNTNLQRACSAIAYNSEGKRVNINNNQNKYLLKNGVGIILGGTNDNFGIDLNINKTRMVYGVDYFTLLPNGTFRQEDYNKGLFYSDSEFSSLRLARGEACLLFTNGGKTSDGKTLIQHCAEGYGHWSLGNTCGALIQCNGWEVPKDYPVRF